MNIDTKKSVYLQASKVYKSYKTGENIVSVLRGIDFSAFTGEWVAILGASGSGKTTLLNILGALEMPDSGEITLGGTPYSGMSNNEAAEFRRQKVGFIFQSYHMLPEFTLIENVMLPGMLGRTNWVGVKKRAEKLIDQVKLSHRIEHKPTELSGGEQQRVAIARSLINEPSIVLADEPTGNLDSETGKEILEIFKGLHDFNKTIIMVTHDLEVAKFADRIVRVRDGITEGEI